MWGSIVANANGEGRSEAEGQDEMKDFVSRLGNEGIDCGLFLTRCNFELGVALPRTWKCQVHHNSNNKAIKTHLVSCLTEAVHMEES